MKKHEEILKELKRRIKSKNQFCEMNDCEPTDYMLGATNEIEELIDFIEVL